MGRLKATLTICNSVSPSVTICHYGEAIEIQIQVKEEYAERVAEICIGTFKEVTEFFNFRILLEGEAKIGNNWKETH